MSDPTKPMNERQRAFKRYKEGTARHGKAFMPYGTWHDVIVGTLAVAIVIVLSMFWYSNAACGKTFDLSCGGSEVLTAHEQAVLTGEISEEAEVDKIKSEYTERTGEEFPDQRILLGPLYEEAADPATTEYHPRPEWYFYFLFYLLVVFSNPNLVLLGTIGVPTILLVLLLAWPFLDRSRERRPSRRPLAMVTMIASAVVMLTFTWLGSQQGLAEGIPDLTDEQLEMPGYELFTEGGEVGSGQCLSCHAVNGEGGALAPDLSDEAAQNRGVEWQVAHLIDPASETPGSTMPPQEGNYSEEELVELAEFLETLGAAERAAEFNANNE